MSRIPKAMKREPLPEVPEPPTTMDLVTALRTLDIKPEDVTDAKLYASKISHARIILAEANRWYDATRARAAAKALQFGMDFGYGRCLSDRMVILGYGGKPKNKAEAGVAKTTFGRVRYFNAVTGRVGKQDPDLHDLRHLPIQSGDAAKALQLMQVDYAELEKRFSVKDCKARKTVKR